MELLSNLSTQDLNQLFETGCFFILNDLPTGTQFSIDRSTWLTGQNFQGIKLIPPGFHIITISPNPNPSSSSSSGCQKEPSESQSSSSKNQSRSETLRIGYQVKKGLIRFFKPQDRVIRAYDANNEDFQASSEAQTIVSLDYLKTIDPNLAPYPFQHLSQWGSLTNHIRPEHVSRIIGFDEHQDGLLDSLITNHVSLSVHEPPSSFSVPKRTQWGKPRPEDDSILAQQLFSQSRPRTTFWPFIDLKRSWPKDALGPELTKWSRDKSWLFNHLMHQEFKSDPEEVLGLLQLSFVTFMEIQTIQSFEFYQLLMDLISKSNLSELLKLNLSQEEEPSSTSSSSTKTKKIDYLSLTLEVIRIFGCQLTSLPDNFFAESMEDFQIENWFFKLLDRLRIHLNVIINLIVLERSNKGPGDREGEDQAKGSRPEAIINQEKILLEIDWPALQSTCKRFDWNVKPLKFLLKPDPSTPPNPSQLLAIYPVHNPNDDEEDEERSSDEEEDDEFKPIIVPT